MSGLRFIVLLLAVLPLVAQNLKEFEKKVTEFTLPNGLHFIVVERHEAPVVSFHTYVGVGSVDDPSGETGLAHMFEHMAFKGTETIGTTDWTAEKKSLDAVEAAYDRLDAERNKGPKADQARLGLLQAHLRAAIDAAQAFVVPNQYTRVIEENGGVGLNAFTATDSTEYFYSLPSNRLELWFLLESQRFLHPVFREFYKERDVVMEEERMRVESNPTGKLMLNFKATAFAAHPYRRPEGGWPSDIESLRRPEAQVFFDKYYVPGNMNVAIVGDVNPAEARRLAERYFGPLPARPLPPLIHTVEPPQPGPKTVVVDSPSQPVLFIGYKRPDQYDADDPVFDLIELILTGGRTGVVYKDLVQDKRIALQVRSGSTFPDGRYPNLFVFSVAPSLGHTVDENEKELNTVLARFLAQGPDAEALQRAKNQARAQVIRQLANNAGLASLLTTYYGNYGDWRKLFTQLDDLNKITAGDVRRVARRYFIPSARTVAYLQNASGRPAPRRQATGGN